MTIAVLIYGAFIMAAMLIYFLHAQIHIHDFTVMILQAVSVPLGLLIFPLGFLCSFNYQHFQKIFCFKGRRRRRQYANLDEGTCPASDRVSQPSSTFFVIPHTNAFPTEAETNLMKKDPLQV